MYAMLPPSGGQNGVSDSHAYVCNKSTLLLIMTVEYEAAPAAAAAAAAESPPAAAALELAAAALPACMEQMCMT